MFFFDPPRGHGQRVGRMDDVTHTNQRRGDIIERGEQVVVRAFVDHQILQFRQRQDQIGRSFADQ